MQTGKEALISLTHSPIQFRTHPVCKIIQIKCQNLKKHNKNQIHQLDFSCRDPAEKIPFFKTESIRDVQNKRNLQTE